MYIVKPSVLSYWLELHIVVYVRGVGNI